MHYEVIGNFSDINLNDVFVKDNLNKISIDEKMIKKISIAVLSIVLFFAFNEVVHAQEIIGQVIQQSPGGYSPPTKLHAIFEFIRWFIWLAKWVFSGVIGSIFTIAGWKWGTDLSGNGQTVAKKIMGNCIIGGLIIWTGSTVGGVFVDKMEEILA